MGRKILPKERDKIINTLLRGFPSGKVGLSQAGGTKERMIDVLTPEMMNFYMAPEAGLEIYIRSLAEDVSARNLFGKSESGDLEESMGSYVGNLVQDGKITNEQAIKLRELLYARFNSKSPEQWAQFIKEFGYITTLGSPLNSIVQLKDLILSVYRNGSLFGTIKNLVKTVFNKSEISLIDVGLEKGMSEFMEVGGGKKWLQSVFNWNFMTFMDRLGKETYINTAVESLRKQIQDDKSTAKFMERLRKSFTEEELLQVVDDLKSGKITDNIKFLAFSELSQIQPITLSEMPQKYLEMKTGKLAYMLKSYSIKQLDIARQDVVNTWRSGNKVKAVLNLSKLLFMISLWGATIDELRDYIRGQEVDFSDHVIDNMLQFFFVSRYSMTTLSKDGFSGFMKDLIVPPLKTLDTVTKAMFAAKGKRMDTFTKDISRSIPIVGELYYWWFGGGKKSKPKVTTSSSNSKLKRPGSGGSTSKTSKLKRPGTTKSSTKSKLKRPTTK
jgi:hypothetical protein